MSDFHSFVKREAALGRLVVQPRMGFAQPEQMRAGLEAVRSQVSGVAGTITVDAYTRVGQEDRAAEILASGGHLNGYPISVHPTQTTFDVLDGIVGKNFPVQVRHGSAFPANVFQGAVACELYASEGGSVSYNLPYSRAPLAQTAKAWREATTELAKSAEKSGNEAHLESFGGCMFGQLCPPSLLAAISVLEARSFVQSGVQSVSLSLAQGSSPEQDIAALRAMRKLAEELLVGVEFHIVFYTFMGLFPETLEGSRALIEDSARVAVLGGAERLIVKTAAEARGIPTVDENIEALLWARVAADTCSYEPGEMVVHWQDRITREARALIDAVLDLSDDPYSGLVKAFDQGVLDVPYALHPDNEGLTRAAIDPTTGALLWGSTGRMPLPDQTDAALNVTAHTFHETLSFVRNQYDRHGSWFDQALEKEVHHV